MKQILFLLLFFCLVCLVQTAEAQQYSEAQLSRWLKRFPDADTNKDGKLTAAEAKKFRNKMRGSQKRSGGAPKTFKVDPGWKKEKFPDHAACYLSPQEIAELYAKVTGGDKLVRYAQPTDGSLRIVGTGHSFMAPGYQTFPSIAKAAGFKQPPLVTHTSGGMTGSARYKWEQENGIFQFDGKPTPKLLASISNGQWDAMMWGPYYQDRPEYYSCWIEFCLKYNPEMKFYLSDGWPQLDQLDKLPKSEDELTSELIAKLGKQRYAEYSKIIADLNEEYQNKVFIIPTSEAMVLCAKYYNEGKLPGIDGMHKFIGKNERSLWRDRLGHLGPGLERLEGYVFYATLYGRSPELIEGDVFRKTKFPGVELDRRFREIAWKAVLNNPLSGVTDKNKNGIADDRE